MRLRRTRAHETQSFVYFSCITSEFQKSIENNGNTRRKKGTWHRMEVNRRDEKQEPERRLRIVQMSGEPAPTHYLPPRQDPSERSHALDTRVQGRWLLLARVGWGALVVLTLAIFFASLPMYLAQLQTPCTEFACVYQQLTNSQAKLLEEIGLSIGNYAAFTLAIAFASILMCLVVSTLIIWRRPDDRMAFFVALMLVTLGPTNEFGTVPLNSSSPWLVPNLCMSLLAQALLVLVFLLFPSGHFVPRWTRWTFFAILALQIPFTLLPSEPLLLNNPGSQFGWFVTIGWFVLIVAVQFYRYRRVSSPRERQQTKWVVFALAVPITVIVIMTVLGLFFPTMAERSPLYLLVFNEGGFLMPLFLSLSFGFAMLRSRLWDIDVLINRTLVYGALTVILTGVYIGLVIGLQGLLRGIINQSSGVAIVLSTLAIAALFQPLRRRIQRIIDRRFYRSKYDAAKTVAAFSATLRQEVDLEQLREQLLAVVQETMQPASLTLWIRPVKQRAAGGRTRRESSSRGGERPGADSSDAR